MAHRVASDGGYRERRLCQFYWRIVRAIATYLWINVSRLAAA